VLCSFHIVSTKPVHQLDRLQCQTVSMQSVYQGTNIIPDHALLSNRYSSYGRGSPAGGELDILQCSCHASGTCTSEGCLADSGRPVAAVMRCRSPLAAGPPRAPGLAACTVSRPFLSTGEPECLGWCQDAAAPFKGVFTAADLYGQMGTVMT
jgi:hypothetical protein